MSYNFDQLGISASVGVSGAILTVSTLIIISQVIAYIRSWNYPEMQWKTIVVLFMPVTQGWLSWICFFSANVAVVSNFFIALYISCALLCFYSLTQMLVLRQLHNQEETLTKKQIISQVFLKQEKVTCRLRCCGSFNTNTLEKAVRYSKIVDIAIYQNITIIIILGIVGGIVKFTESEQMDPSNSTIDTTIFWIALIKAVSTGIVMMFLLTWINALNQDEQLKKLKLGNKAIVIQIGYIIPNIQGIFINIFASQGLIADDDHSDYEIQIFTQSLLVCCEMVILSFLLQMTFPVSDYKKSIRSETDVSS